MPYSDFREETPGLSSTPVSGFTHRVFRFYNFDTGRSEVKETHRQALGAEVLPLLFRSGLVLRIAGQASKKGSDALNNTLSLERARALESEIKAAGLQEASRVEVFGSGSFFAAGPAQSNEDIDRAVLVVAQYYSAAPPPMFKDPQPSTAPFPAPGGNGPWKLQELNTKSELMIPTSIAFGTVTKEIVLLNTGKRELSRYEAPSVQGSVGLVPMHVVLEFLSKILQVSKNFGAAAPNFPGTTNDLYISPFAKGTPNDTWFQGPVTILAVAAGALFATECAVVLFSTVPLVAGSATLAFLPLTILKSVKAVGFKVGSALELGPNFSHSSGLATLFETRPAP